MEFVLGFILLVLYLAIVLVASLPAALVATFKVSAILGIYAIITSIIGIGLYKKTIQTYPILKDDVDRAIGFPTLLIMIMTFVWGWAYPAEEFIAIVIKIVNLFFGGFILSLLFGVFPAIVLFRCIMRIYQNAMLKTLNTLPTGVAKTNHAFASTLFIKKINWLTANLKRLNGGRYMSYEHVISPRGYDILKDNAEQFLLQNGERDVEQLSSELTDNSARRYFLPKVLDDLIASSIITKQSKGLTFDKDGNPLKSSGFEVEFEWIYIHNSNPMKSTEIVLDDEDF